MLKVSIIGGSGYSGAELLRILSRREDINIRQITANSSAGSLVSEVYPVFSGLIAHRYDSIGNVTLEDIDVLFITLPSGEAMNLVPSYVRENVRIIDLGGDLRLQSAALYEEYYGVPHKSPHLLGTSVYGLPELNRSAIRTATMIANPGCYPTSIILPLYPLIREGIIDTENIVINSLSGVSGAGRKATIEYSFTELNENVKAYKVTKHQHIPEITSVLQCATGKTIGFSFVPHLIPITRGIYTTIHANLSVQGTHSKLCDVLNDYYGNEPFVRIVREIPSILNVSHTNYCDIYCTVQEKTGQAIIITVIDNLLKGAAGQAVQNLNIMFDLPETKGLL